MITIQEQQLLFVDIGNKLPKKITAYAIGGTAMMFHGLKGTTLDIDLVFMNSKDRLVFNETARSLGFNEMDSRVVYKIKDNVPEMLSLGDVRLDLFLPNVITSSFSEKMQERARQIHEFGNLIIKIADVHDIIIMKAVTGREKDDLDIVNILENSKINWEIVVEESQNQIKLGNVRALMDIGATFENIENKKGIKIPKEISDKIWKLFNKQVREKAKKSK
jgi:hypothetical protein